MSSLKMCPFVFVYGTLKTGFRANYKLDQSTKIGEAITPPQYWMYGSGFPMLVENDPGWSVKGEVYSVHSEGVLSQLDAYEGFPSFYNRKIIPVGGLEGVSEAWIYFNKPNQIGGSTLMINPNPQGLLVWDNL